MSDFYKSMCPHCGQHLEVPPDMEGQTIPCPSCAKQIIIPVRARVVVRSVTRPPHPVSKFPNWTLVFSFFAFAVCGLSCISPKLFPYWLGTMALAGIGIYIAQRIKFKCIDKNDAANTDTIHRLESEKSDISRRITEFENYLSQIGYHDYDSMQFKIKALKSQHADVENQYSLKLASLEANEHAAKARYTAAMERYDKAESTATREEKKVAKLKDAYKSIQNCITNWLAYDPRVEYCKMPPVAFEEVDMLAPSTEARLHSMEIKDLRKAFRENEKQMESLFTQYEGLYGNKANSAIYALIVVALRAELQSILLNLRYGTTEKANTEVQKALQRANLIASEGNKIILPTLTKFMGQLEYHFYEAVKIEHLYYVRKEQQRLEQIALREQMKQEAAERKALEEAQKRIAEEEAKYQTEMARLQEALATATPEKQEEVQSRMQEIQAQMAEMVVKKEKIASLAKGKAGTVYIISNLGAFGDKVFKIGMTRRAEPQDRIDELGSASVPFEFDVHSFIFSNDAVSLEGALHDRLNDSRLNKVNTRKEFFTTDIDALEQLVQEIEPTAVFNRTMAAEEFHASQGHAMYSEVVASSTDDDGDSDESA